MDAFAASVFAQQCGFPSRRSIYSMIRHAASGSSAPEGHDATQDFSGLNGWRVRLFEDTVEVVPAYECQGALLSIVAWLLWLSRGPAL